MIHGLSQRRTLIRGGKIRIGDKTRARNGREIPRKLDHFRFVPDDPALLPHWQRLYGERPTTLPVMLPSDRRDDIFPHEYRYWKGSRLFCRGDNRQAQRLEPGGGHHRLSCSPKCPFRNDPELGQTDPKRHPCRPEGTLRLLLPELPTMQTFELTARKLSIVRINSCLDVIEQTCGRIDFVPLTLGLVPARITVGDQPMTIYLLHLDVRVSLLELARRRNIDLADAAQLPTTSTAPTDPLDLPPRPATPALTAGSTNAESPSTQPASAAKQAGHTTAPQTQAAETTAIEATGAQTQPPPNEPNPNKPNPNKPNPNKPNPNKTDQTLRPDAAAGHLHRPSPDAAPTVPPQRQTPSNAATAPLTTRATCLALIQTLPPPQRPVLVKTLDNMKNPGDLKGFYAYLQTKTAPTGRAA